MRYLLLLLGLPGLLLGCGDRITYNNQRTVNIINPVFGPCSILIMSDGTTVSVSESPLGAGAVVEINGQTFTVQPDCSLRPIAVTNPEPPPAPA